MANHDRGVIAPDLRPEMEPVSAGGAQPRSRSSRLVNLALGAALVVAIGGVSFAVGRGTAPATTPTAFGPGGPGLGNGGFPNASGIPNGGGFGPAGAGGPSIEGTVTAIDGDSMTIETTAGQMIEVAIDAGTEYHKQQAAGPADVTQGSTVIVQVDGFVGRVPGGPGSSTPPSSGDPGTTATDITVVP
jgi:hypothetical protein